MADLVASNPELVASSILAIKNGLTIQLVTGGGGTRWHIQGKATGLGQLVFLDGNNNQIIQSFQAPVTFDTGLISVNYIKAHAEGGDVKIEYTATHQ